MENLSSVSPGTFEKASFKIIDRESDDDNLETGVIEDVDNEEIESIEEEEPEEENVIEEEDEEADVVEEDNEEENEEQPDSDDFEHSVGNFLSEYTQGYIQSVDDIASIVEENERLKEELESKGEIEFPSEQAKKLYEFASRFTGNEFKAAQNYLNAVSIDVGSSDAKTLQLEAFILERPDLSRERALAIFNAKYERTYGDMDEDDVLLQDEHEMATRKAKEVIANAKKEFESSSQNQVSEEDSTPTVEQEQIMEAIGREMENFAGLQFEFDEGVVMNFGVESREEVSEIQKLAANPQEFFNEYLSRFMDERGNFDYHAYSRDFYFMLNKERVVSEAQKFGYEKGIESVKRELKNQKLPDQSSTPSKKQPSFKDAWREAYKKVNG
jgi:hypothetical protein